MGSDRGLVIAVVQLGWAIGCGGGPGSPDASSADAGEVWMPAAPAAPAPPLPPAPPVLTPCPAGWREASTHGGASVCDPWPEGGPAACAAPDEAHFPGEPGCTRIGSACPGDGIPAGLPAGVPVLHVRAGASAGGDGSPAAPFARIEDALAVAPAGTIVAVAAGTYDESITMRRSVTVWGACVGETVLAPSAAGAPAVVTAAPGAEAIVRNLTIGPHGGSGIRVLGALALEDAAVRSTLRTGVLVEDGASLSARRVAIIGVSVDPLAPGAFLGGVVAPAAARVELRAVVVSGVPEVGMVLDGSIELEDVAIRNVECAEQAAGGVYLLRDADAVLRRTVIERICGRGVFADATDVSLRASDLVIRSTRAPLGMGIAPEAGSALDFGAGEIHVDRALVVDAAGSPAVFLAQDGRLPLSAMLADVVIERSAGPGRNGAEVGVWIDGGAAVAAHRLRLEDVYGVVVRGGSDATLVDTTVHWTSRGPLELIEGGIACTGGGTLTVERALVERALWGFFVDVFERGAGCTTTASDLTVRDTFGAVWLEGSTSRVSRVRVERTTRAGVAVIGGQAELWDVDVEDVDVPADEPRARPTWGDGVVLLGPEGSLSRARVRRHHSVGLRVDGQGSRMVVEDLDIAEGRGGPVTSRAGGVIATGTVSLARVRVEGDRAFGLSVGSRAESPPASIVTVEDLAILDTAGVADGTLGIGVVVAFTDGFDGSRLTLTRAVVEGSREVAVMATAGGELVARQVRVARTGPRDCHDTTCPTEPGGHGLGVYDAWIDVEDLDVAGSYLCGLHHLARRDIRVGRTFLRENAIGLCVETSDQVTALGREIVFEDNGVPVQAGAGDFFVPEPPAPPPPGE